MGAQGLASDQFDRPSKLFFQEKREGHKVIKGLFPGGELD